MGRKTTNVIEINGKLYDAHSGKLVDKKSDKATRHSEPSKKSPIKKKPTKGSPRTIDGFAISKNKPASKPKKTATKKPEIKSKPHNSKTHSKAPNLKSRAQKSKTLNRRAVSAPLIEVDKTSMPNLVQTKEEISKRLERAMKVSKSSIISRFPHSETSKETTHTAKKAEKEEPKAELVHEKITKEKPAKIEKPAKAKKTKKRSIKKHVSYAGYAVSAATVLVVAAYVTYLNVPSVSMKVAASQAGFDATLPEYKPSGYAILGPVKYSPGFVTIDFKSKSDGNQFSLNQQPTNWDSLALKDDVSTKSELEPLTQQYNGITVYLYEGKAAWVNAGKLYTLDTKGSQLGVDQMLKLAASM